MKDAPLAPFYALLGIEAAAVILTRMDVRDWGQTLVLAGTAGDQPFELRYTDCRELRWRVYVTNPADETPLVSFAAGRDQQRSPAQFLTAHFGLSLFYGSLAVSTR
jgi:hypothetical protein